MTNTTRSMILAAAFVGLVGLAGCDKGSDSEAPAAPGATSEAPASSAPATPAPAAEPSTSSGTSSSSAPAPASESSSASTDTSSLPQTCQDYFKKAEELVAKSGASSEQLKQMIDQQRTQMNAIKDQAQLETSCKQAVDMLEQQTKNMPQ